MKEIFVPLPIIFLLCITQRNGKGIFELMWRYSPHSFIDNLYSWPIQVLIPLENFRKKRYQPCII